MDILNFQNLVKHLTALRKETEWLELKHNNDNPQEIGEYISALSNGAALLGWQKRILSSFLGLGVITRKR